MRVSKVVFGHRKRKEKERFRVDIQEVVSETMRCGEMSSSMAKGKVQIHMLSALSPES